MAVITVTTPAGAIATFSVPLGTTPSALASMVAAELGLRQPLTLQLNGSPLAANASTLESAGVSEGDLLLAVPGAASGGGGGAAAAPATRPSAGPPAGAAAGFGGMMASGQGMPISAQQLIEQATVQPQLVAALEAMSPQAAAAVRRRDVRAVQGFLDMLSASMGWGGVPGSGGASGPGGGGAAAAAGAVVDPAEEERLKDVAANFEQAIEHVPESFAPVVMLYVRAAVAGVPVVAFVDSGAQATILSRSTAERCGVGRLLDTRFSGVARGVGTAKILGKVHLALLTLGGDGAASLGAGGGGGRSSSAGDGGDGGNASTTVVAAASTGEHGAEPPPSAVLDASFTVMEDASFDMLLGLDMMKKHRMVIDLSRNALVVHGIAVPFLAERDIPKNLLGSEGAPAPPGAATVTAGGGAAAASSAAAAGGGAPLGSPASAAALRGLSAAAAAAGAAPAPAAAAPRRAPAAAPRAAPPPTAAAPVSEALVATLVGLGFERPEAVQALAACGGNAELAANMLSQAKYGF